MSMHADDLFAQMETMPFWDRYAKPCLPNLVLTNATELIRTPAKDRMVSLFLRDKKNTLSDLSDFEYFCAVATLFSRWLGTSEGAFTEREFFILYGKSFEIEMLFSDEFVRELWQVANERLATTNGTYTDFLQKNGVEKLYDREDPFFSLGRVEKYKEQGKNLALLCNLCGMDFLRPDPYHAACAEQKRACGERLNLEEQAILTAQAIYRLCTDDRERSVDLRLLADGDGKTAFNLIAYLKRLGVRGHVRIAADGRMSVGTLLALCEQTDAVLTVTPEIVLGENDSRRYAYERLLALSARYPIELWRFGGAPCDAPLFFAGHLHMRRVIAELLCHLTDREHEQLRLAEQIFGRME